MKKPTFLLLAIVILSCQTKKQEQPTSKKDLVQVTIETDYCLDLPKAYFWQDKTETFFLELPLDVQNINSAYGGFGFGYTSKLIPEF